LRIDKCDESFEDLRTAVVDGIGGASKVEVIFTVWTSLRHEFLGEVSVPVVVNLFASTDTLKLHDRADHARAEVALLGSCDEA